MKKQESKKIIVGNWKMHKTIDETEHFIDSVLPLIDSAEDQIALAVPFTSLKVASDKVAQSRLWIGSQNINDASQGAFTGEVAAGMVKDAGAKFTLLGHSERRRIFGESNAFINRKVHKAVSEELMVILCVGESYDDREVGKTEEVLKSQIIECLEKISEKSIPFLILAYEPIWAIGTGKSADPEIVEAAHEICRKVLVEVLGQKASTIPIIYGGSVSAENASALLEKELIGGLLVGNASLSGESFGQIIKWRESALSISK